MFKNISSYASSFDNGGYHVSSFRKTFGPNVATTSAWGDLSYFAGYPLANFYASNPLESSLVDKTRGFELSNFDSQVQMNRFLIQTVAVSTGSNVAGRMLFYLLDYLMYYPFIDTDDLSQQDFTNSIVLPRYPGGQVMMVALSATISAATFTMTYTNDKGVPGRVTPINNANVVTGGGYLVNGPILSAVASPFISLQAGDAAVKSIESVTMLSPGGGIVALVIVKPLLFMRGGEESRVDSVRSFGNASVYEYLLNSFSPVIVKQGAILNLICSTAGGSLAGNSIMGAIETIRS